MLYLNNAILDVLVQAKQVGLWFSNTPRIEEISAEVVAAHEQKITHEAVAGPAVGLLVEDGNQVIGYVS